MLSNVKLEYVLELRGNCIKGKTDQTIYEKYISAIEGLEDMDNDIKYSLLLETNIIEMMKPEVIYPEYYLQKKRILESLAFYYYGEIKKVHAIRRKKKRIAICTNTWWDRRYSIGVVIAALANAFLRQGYEVSVFIENQFKHDARIQDILSPQLLVDAHIYIKEHEKMLLRGVKVQYNEGSKIGIRVVNQINSIFMYKPECIIDITDENSCCSRILYEKIPVLYFPMRGNHGTSMFFQKYLAVNPQKMKEINQIYHSFDDRKIEKFVGGITEFPDAKVHYDKKNEFGRSGCFVLVTVGNRLVYDLNREFIDFAIKVLLSNPGFIWVFVGSEIPDDLTREREKRNLQKQIILRGYEKDLIALYRICDIYVNPMRKGGGISIAWAMHEGLPVAMLRYLSDGLSWLGEENAVDGSYEELYEYINSLSCDKELYIETQKKMQERVCQRTPEKCVRRIVQIIDELREDKGYD